MKTESLHEVITAAPFRPFKLRLADGSRIEIRHPEWIAHPSGARTAVVMNADESIRIIDVGLVLEVELGPPVPAGTPAADPNGGE